MGMRMKAVTHRRRSRTMVMIMVVGVVGGRRRKRSSGTIRYSGVLSLRWDFSFDILKCFSPIRMEIWMTKSPALGKKR